MIKESQRASTRSGSGSSSLGGTNLSPTRIHSWDLLTPSRRLTALGIPVMDDSTLEAARAAGLDKLQSSSWIETSRLRSRGLIVGAEVDKVWEESQSRGDE